MAEATSLDAIASLMKLFTGDAKTKTTGGFTETSGTNLDEATLASLLKTQLESNSGLASVTQGQKAAGLYNSSTNRLMANDLLARLTARTAEAGAQKTVTRSPSVNTEKNAGSDLLTKGALALTAYQKLGGGKLASKANAKLGDPAGALGDAANIAAYSLGGGVVPAADLFSANSQSDPLGALIQSQGWTPESITNNSQSVETLMAPMMAADMGANGYGDILSDSFSGFTADQIGTAPSADQFTVPTEEVATEDTTNFSSASSTGADAPAGGATSSEVLANNATTLSNTQLLSGGGASAMGLYSGISALTDDNSGNDLIGAAKTGLGAYGAYNTYQAYQAAEAAKAAAAAAEAAGTASDVATASSSGGSALGYAGAAMSALYAPNNPMGAQDKDYRHAVGSAVLNYFGFGWAAPIVHEVAEPVLNETMGNAEEVNGVQGAFMADPVGMPISGRYELDDVATSNLDPANLFGGNPGGSVGGMIGQAADPIGTLIFGNDSAGGAMADLIDSDPVTSFVQDLGGGCFLTTACMIAKADEFKDNCHELKQMRALRDNYVAQLPEGTDLISEYYHIAPAIVSGINKNADAKEIWTQMYSKYLEPAVAAMDSGSPELAYDIYMEMAEFAKTAAQNGKEK